MKYFVTGGTGFIGSKLIEKLVEGGDEVLVLTRSASNADHLPDSVTPVEGNITDADSLREPMTSVDGVFHLAGWYDFGTGPWNEEWAERVNVQGTRVVLQLMDDLDIQKGVYSSTLGVTADTHGEVVDETYRHEGTFDTVYERTKWEAHFEVAKPRMAEGLPLVIAMPGVVYGPEAHGPIRNKVFVPYLNGNLPMIPREGGLSFEHVDDTAQSLIRAMEKGVPGEEYIICGHNRTYVELFTLAEEITGIPAPRAMPPAIFDLLGRLVSLIEPTIQAPEGYRGESLSVFAGNTYYGDNSKARRELGIEHRSLEDGLRDYFEWEMDQQGIPS